MLRPPKVIVPVDPEHQPHIKKFVTDTKKTGVASFVTGKTITKATLKKRRQRSTGEPKPKNQKRRPVLNSESCSQSVANISTTPLSLSTMMSNTTLNPMIMPGTTMLEEIKNMEERLKLSIKENR